MARILDGKALSTTMKDELRAKIASWVNNGHRAPSLKCIIVGNDPASHTYVKNKVQAAAYVGIVAETIKREENITEEQLIAEIQELNADSNVDGILVQLPIPETMDERRVCNAVTPEKDVDGFHILNVGKLCLDMPTLVPATALAVIEMLKRLCSGHMPLNGFKYLMNKARIPNCDICGVYEDVYHLLTVCVQSASIRDNLFRVLDVNLLDVGLIQGISAAPTSVAARMLYQSTYRMLKNKVFNIDTHGRNAVVIGRSKNVGMPIAMMLHSDKRHDNGLGMDATVTICHRYTPADKLAFYCQNADIIITATGIPKLIKADMVKPGATIIDVGITRITTEEGKTRLVGDVDYDEVSKIAGAITPVPGGVGPMTVTMLMHNTFQAAQTLYGKEVKQ